MTVAVLYARVSSKEQTKNLSLDSQIRDMTAYCDRQGWGVAQVFTEPGKSAKTRNTIDPNQDVDAFAYRPGSFERPAFRRMVTYCREHRDEIDYIVVSDVKRFGRDATDHLVVRRYLATFGIGLRSLAEPFDDQPFGRVIETLFASLAQQDNEDRGAKAKRGMMARFDRGDWVWRGKREGRASARP